MTLLAIAYLLTYPLVLAICYGLVVKVLEKLDNFLAQFPDWMMATAGTCALVSITLVYVQGAVLLYT